MNWDEAFRREIKRFNAETARRLARKPRKRATALQAEPLPSTWDEALQGAQRRLRRKVACMRKSGAPAISDGITPPE